MDYCFSKGIVVSIIELKCNIESSGCWPRAKHTRVLPAAAADAIKQCAVGVDSGVGHAPGSFVPLSLRYRPVAYIFSLGFHHTLSRTLPVTTWQTHTQTYTPFCVYGQGYYTCTIYYIYVIILTLNGCDKYSRHESVFVSRPRPRNCTLPAHSRNAPTRTWMTYPNPSRPEENINSRYRDRWPVVYCFPFLPPWPWQTVVGTRHALMTYSIIIIKFLSGPAAMTMRIDTRVCDRRTSWTVQLTLIETHVILLI